MSNTVEPSGQIVYNSYLYQDGFSGYTNEPKFYLTRLINFYLRSLTFPVNIHDYANDGNYSSLVEGFNAEFYGIKNGKTLQIRVNPGIAIADSTLISLEKSVILDIDITGDNSKDSALLAVDYRYPKSTSESAEQYRLRLYLYNEQDGTTYNPSILWDNKTHKLILTQLKFERDVDNNITSVVQIPYDNNFFIKYDLSSINTMDIDSYSNVNDISSVSDMDYPFPPPKRTIEGEERLIAPKTQPEMNILDLKNTLNWHLSQFYLMDIPYYTSESAMINYITDMF